LPKPLVHGMVPRLCGCRHGMPLRDSRCRSTRRPNVEARMFQNTQLMSAMLCYYLPAMGVFIYCFFGVMKKHH
jgi:hypothetical protein